MNFENNDPVTTKYICNVNGCVIDYSEFSQMDISGRWQSQDGTWYDEELNLFFDTEGQLVDDPRHIGVVLWGAYSYHQTWADGVYDFLKARVE